MEQDRFFPNVGSVVGNPFQKAGDHIKTEPFAELNGVLLLSTRHWSTLYK